MKRNADSESAVTVDEPVLEETYVRVVLSHYTRFSVRLSLHQVIFWNALSIAPTARADGK